MVDRVEEKAPRGRPSHRYRITAKGRSQSGANFGDLAIALWDEIRQIKDTDVRRGLLQRLSNRMAAMYAPQVRGEGTEERMQTVARMFTERNIPVAVEHDQQLPVLTVEACPYPQLAEQDRGICSVEKMMFSELLGKNVALTDCRLDGANCCRFVTQ
jgi:predicted ArsR family transcriptional regulator